MPKKEDLEQLQQRLLRIAKEDTLLAAQGLDPEFPEPPEPVSVSGEFDDLLEVDSTPSGSGESEEAAVDYSQQLFDSVQDDDVAEDSVDQDGQGGFVLPDDDPFAEAAQGDFPEDLFSDDAPVGLGDDLGGAGSDLGDSGDFGELGGTDDFSAGGDLGDADDFSDAGEFGDLGDAGAAGAAGAVDEPAAASADESAPTTDADDFSDDFGGEFSAGGDLGDFGDLGDLDGADDLGEAGAADEPAAAADDFSDDFGGTDDFGDLADAADADEPAATADTDDFSNDFSDDFGGEFSAGGDLGDLGDFGDLGDLGGADDLGEGGAADEPAAAADDFSDSDFGGTDDFGDLADAADADEPAATADTDDFSDDFGGEFSAGGDLGDLGDFGDLGDLGSADEPADPGDFSDAGDLGDDFGGTDDFGDLADATSADEPAATADTDDFDLEGFAGQDFSDTGDEAVFADLASTESVEDEISDLDEMPADLSTSGLDDIGGIPVEDMGPLDDMGASSDSAGFDDFDSDASSDGADAPDFSSMELPVDFSEEEGAASDFGDDMPDFDSISPETDSGDSAFAGDSDDITELGGAIGDDDDEFGEDLDVDEFSLGDFGAEFGVLDDETTEIVADQGSVDFGEDAEMLEESAEDQLQLSQEDFALLRRNLQLLPLNVKFHVEDIIAEGHGSPRQQKSLLDQVIRGENPRNIAGSAGRIIGKKIVVPKGYEKHTGLEFEKKKDTLAYQLLTVVWPVIRTAVIIMVVTAVVSLSAYRYVFSPLYAGFLYGQGYEALQEDAFSDAERHFAHAQEYYYSRSWFIRYGEGYRDKREFSRARDRFNQALQRWPDQEDVRLAYADMESVDLVHFDRAEELLQGYYNPDEGRTYDYDIELARGDNYLRWGDQEYDQYENARKAYARLMEHEGVEDVLVFRMMRYFVRTDNMPELDRLQQYIAAVEKIEIDGQAYGEYGGYLIDKHLENPIQNSLEGVNTILLDALDAAPRHPPTYYHLARLYRLSINMPSENQALDAAIQLFDSQRPLDQGAMEMLIDSIIRRGENYAKLEQDVDALQYLTRAKREYEDAVSRLLVSRQARFGRLYDRLGDIYYYRGSEYEDALEMYNEARLNQYTTLDMEYKVGVIHYRAQRYDDALNAFLDARGSFSEERNLDYAMANTLFRRDAYSSAVGYYERLLQQLVRERQQIPTLRVHENPKHRALIEYLRRTYNNLGVALLRESQVNGSRANWTRGMTYLTQSAEISEDYLRDPETGERAASSNLGYLNVRSGLVPSASFNLEIFDSLLPDFEATSFLAY
jgi:tetratricopeptide (TPR) repeat protein